MNLKITGRNIDISETTKEFAEKKVKKLEKILVEIVDAEIIISQERYNYIVDINLNSKVAFLNAKEKGKDIKTALKSAFDLITKQAKKEKEIVKNKKRKKPEQEESLERMDEAQLLITSESYTLKPINIKEAIVMLNNSPDGVFAFNNIDSGHFSVIFKKGAKEIGIIEFKG
jgi:putative sigma-54 modulation protein